MNNFSEGSCPESIIIDGFENVRDLAAKNNKQVASPARLSGNGSNVWSEQKKKTRGDVNYADSGGCCCCGKEEKEERCAWLEILEQQAAHLSARWSESNDWFGIRATHSRVESEAKTQPGRTKRRTHWASRRKPDDDTYITLTNLFHTLAVEADF